jgi:hypothetical protein
VVAPSVPNRFSGLVSRVVRDTAMAQVDPRRAAQARVTAQPAAAEEFSQEC